MKKIPTLFLRDPATNYKRLTRVVHPDCAWVPRGEGQATRKFDGACAMVRDGALYKRREVKAGKTPPPWFELIETDDAAGKSVGWVPVVGSDPNDRWFAEAYGPGLDDGTYELVGPKVQGNPEGYEQHTLVRHGSEPLSDAPTDFDGLAEYLKDTPYEGVVWHHPDGRMAKIKRKDFY